MLTGSKLCFTINRLSYHTTGWLLLDSLGVIFVASYINKITGNSVLVSFKVEVLIDKCKQSKIYVKTFSE